MGDLVVLIAAGLMDMLAQDLAQGLLQQVGGGVVAADGGTALLIDGSGDLIVNVDGAVQQLTGVNEIALRGLFDLGDLQLGVAADKITVVSDLAAHLGIERGTVQHDQHAVLGLARLVGGDGIDELLPVGQSQNLSLLGQGLVAVKLGGLGGQLTEQVSAPTGNILGQALGTGALTLLGHLDVERGSSTAKPASAAISRVRSSGKPKVSFSLNASTPDRTFSWASFRRPIMPVKMFRPASMVRPKRSSSVPMTFLI